MTPLFLVAALAASIFAIFGKTTRERALYIALAWVWMSAYFITQ